MEVRLYNYFLVFYIFASENKWKLLAHSKRSGGGGREGGNITRHPLPHLPRWFFCSPSLWTRLQNSPYFCVFKYARAVKQKVWNEAENRERDWGETLKFFSRLTRPLRARKTLTPRFTDFFTDFEKKTDCFAVYLAPSQRSKRLDRRNTQTVGLIG